MIRVFFLVFAALLLPSFALASDCAGCLVSEVLATGYVGIGTTSPNTTFTVYTDSSAGSINMGEWGGGRNAIWLNGQSTAGAGGYNILSGAADQNLYLNRPSGNSIRLRDNNVDQMVILDNGSVGIGTTSPSAMLDVKPSTSSIPLFDVINYANTAASYNTAFIHTDQPYLSGNNTGSYTGAALEVTTFPDNGSGNIGDVLKVGTSDASGNSFTTYLEVKAATGNVGIQAASPSYTLQVNGSVAGTSAYNNTSDARLKKNVEPIAYGLDSVMRLRPISFDWIDQGQAWKKKHQLGLIAQEVEPVVPEVVTIADDRMHTRSLAYGELVPVLIKAVQDEQAEIDELKAQLTTLKTGQEAGTSVQQPGR